MEGEAAPGDRHAHPRGVECPVLRTAKGRIYTLSGDLKGLQTGDRVTVAGTQAQASICQQGLTIEVESVRRAPR